MKSGWGRPAWGKAIVRKASVWPPDPLLVPVRTQPSEPHPQLESPGAISLALQHLASKRLVEKWSHDTSQSSWTLNSINTCSLWPPSRTWPGCCSWHSYLFSRDWDCVLEATLGVSGCQWPTVQESILARMFSWIFPVLCCLLFGMKLRTQPSSFSGSSFSWSYYRDTGKEIPNFMI